MAKSRKVCRTTFPHPRIIIFNFFFPLIFFFVSFYLPQLEAVTTGINTNTIERSKFYGLIAFHRSAVVLNTFNSLESSNIDKFIEQIRSLRPRRHLETSPAKALITATQLFPENSNNSKNIIFLVHNGENTDMVNESIEAITKLSAKNISVFAIAGESFNERTLLSYTKEEKGRILTGPKSENLFLSTLDKARN
uniref:VWFA domain-containing protein n=1 Tax=Meloidogyne hapla TaxID=6305 RepID=A0A1I8B0E3_MELHA